MHLCVGLYERIMSLKSVLTKTSITPVNQCDIASVLPNLHFLRDGLFSTVSHLPNALMVEIVCTEKLCGRI